MSASTFRTNHRPPQAKHSRPPMLVQRTMGVVFQSPRGLQVCLLCRQSISQKSHHLSTSNSFAVLKSYNMRSQLALAIAFAAATLPYPYHKLNPSSPVWLARRTRTQIPSLHRLIQNQGLSPRRQGANARYRNCRN